MKRFMRVCLLLMMAISLNAQDSATLRRHADSLVLMQRQLDSVRKEQENADLQREMDQNEENLRVFLAQQRENENKKARSVYIRAGIGVALLGALGVRYMRRRRRKQ
jgi:hypothetical protein